MRAPGSAHAASLSPLVDDGPDVGVPGQDAPVLGAPGDGAHPSFSAGPAPFGPGPAGHQPPGSPPRPEAGSPPPGPDTVVPLPGLVAGPLSPAPHALVPPPAPAGPVRRPPAAGTPTRPSLAPNVAPTLSPAVHIPLPPPPMVPGALTRPVIGHDAAQAFVPFAVQGAAGAGVLPPPPATLPPPPAALPPPPGFYGVVTAVLPTAGAVPPSRMAGFDDNPFTLGRRTYVGPPPSKKKARRPGLRLALLVVLLGAAGFVGYRVTHPSPHRSATAVAQDFYQQLQAGATGGAVADVEPQQQSAAAPVLRSAIVADFARTSLGHQSVQAGTTNTVGADTSVVLQLCNTGLSCIPTLAVPTVDIGGSWYVDWNSWLQTLAPLMAQTAG